MSERGVRSIAVLAATGKRPPASQEEYQISSARARTLPTFDRAAVRSLPESAQRRGRPTTFYQGMGEVDVRKVIDEAKRLFAVDPDRVFIMGHSMGGAGSYTVGLHYPDRFGGIMAGDPAMGPMAAAIPPEVPKWMEPQIAIVSPLSFRLG